MYIDTHTHLYLEEFNDDRAEVVERAVNSHVEKLLLPNIDTGSLDSLLEMTRAYPDVCFPMTGLHPGSVDEHFAEAIQILKSRFHEASFIAIGEIGIDLYWEKKYQSFQEEAFTMQLQWAKEAGLPVVIHARESFNEIFAIMDKLMDERLTGVFHSFTGGREELEKIRSYDFYVGINGIVSFKKSTLPDVLGSIPPDRLLLETDAPYLAPVPYRGRRNESAFLPHTADVIATTLGLKPTEIEERTTENANRLFNID